jgi:alpha-L-rhamnosidase
MASGIFSLQVTIPPNTTATVELPTTNVASVQEGGRAVATQSEIHPVQTRNSHPQYEIGSGDYSFTCTAL